MGLGTRCHLGAGTSGLMNRSISKCQLRGLRSVTGPCAVCDMMQAQSTPAVQGGSGTRTDRPIEPHLWSGVTTRGEGHNCRTRGQSNPKKDGNMKTSRRPWRPPLLPLGLKTQVSPRTKQGGRNAAFFSGVFAVPKAWTCSLPLMPFAFGNRNLVLGLAAWRRMMSSWKYPGAASGSNGRAVVDW